MIDFPLLKNKFSFYLDRKNKRVTIDIGVASQTTSKHLDVSQFNETTTIRSLIFAFHQNTVTLYVDCKEVTELNLELSLSKLYSETDEPVVKLFRERKYPLHFDSSIEQAVSRSNCEKRSNRKGGGGGGGRRGQAEKLLRQHRKETKLLKFERDSSESEYLRKKKDGTKKRDTRNWFGAERGNVQDSENVNDIHRRGDIPMISGDCDGKSIENVTTHSIE